MMRKLFKFLLLCFAIVPFLCGCSESYESLYIRCFEVSQEYSECFLIQYKNYDIMVDSGMSVDANKIKYELEDKVIDHELDLLVCTHAHADHIGGITGGCLSGVDKVNNLIDFGYSITGSKTTTFYSSSLYNNYKTVRDNLINNGTNYMPISTLFSDGSIFRIQVDDDLSINFLKSDFYKSDRDVLTSNDDLNKTSIGFYIEYFKTRYFFLGDTDSVGELSFINNNLSSVFETNKNYKVFLKANHHGASSSNSEALLNYLRPSYIFISAALIKECRYPNAVVLGSATGQQNHPTKDSLSRFKKYTSKVYWNAISGDLLLKYDGTYTITGSGRSYNYLNKSGNPADIQKEKNTTIYDSEFYSIVQ